MFISHNVKLKNASLLQRFHCRALSIDRVHAIVGASRVSQIQKKLECIIAM